MPAMGRGYALDALLAGYLGIDEHEPVRSAIQAGAVLTTAIKTAPTSTIVSEGDSFYIDLTAIANTLIPPPKLSVLFEDEDLFVVSKSPNLLVHPAGGLFEWSVIDAAQQRFPNEELDLCHRLDRQTSGVLIMTKNKAANRMIKKLFAERKVRKTYRALVAGSPPQDTFVCCDPIGHANDDSRVRRKVTPCGLPAETRFRRLASRAGISDVECQPITGRSHQIRVHLAALGFPILGDRLYEPTWSHAHPALVATHEERHALHCMRIEYGSPAGESYQFDDPLPSDMSETWREVALHE